MFSRSQEHGPGDTQCLLAQVSSWETSERLTLPRNTFKPLGAFVRPQPESRETPWRMDEGGGWFDPASTDSCQT